MWFFPGPRGCAKLSARDDRDRAHGRRADALNGLGKIRIERWGACGPERASQDLADFAAADFDRELARPAAAHALAHAPPEAIVVEQARDALGERLWIVRRHQEAVLAVLDK